MDDLNLFLRKLFPNIELVELLKNNSSVMYVNNKEIILKDNEYVKHIPLVMDGRIKVMRNDESGKEVLLYYINPGESCALSIAAGLNHQRSMAYAVADKDTRIMAISIDKLDELIKKFPYLNSFVLELFHKRFNELVMYIDAISFRSIDTRLLDYLDKNKIQDKTGKYVLKTHKQIAEELGTAREVVSRLLKQLENKGAVKNHRGKIEVI